MAHPVPARLSEYTAADGRRFGRTVGAALLVFAGIAAWRGHRGMATGLAVAGAILLATALVAPRALGPVDRGWMAMALAISKVTTPLFMGLVYFVVLTPIGWLRRRFGGNPLVHGSGADAGTWADRTASPRSALDRLF